MSKESKINIYFFKPLDKIYQRYQRYYNLSLNTYLNNFNTKIIPFYKKIKNEKLIDTKSFVSRHDTYVGQYILKFSENGKIIKFSIDTQDDHTIKSKEILEWSDIYFKSNKWDSIAYPKKVLPIINGNGILSNKRINYIKSLRIMKKRKFDLVFISRVWGGREHSIRLFENISKIKCSKYLLAIFTDFDKTQAMTKEYYNRLDKAGVPWTDKTLRIKRLWNYIANARISIIRAGKHLCIPWRMLDQLCIGTCFICDSDPFPKWPNPLQPNINYISLGIRRPKDGSEGPLEDYQKIPEIVNSILNNDNLQERIRQNNINYFEEYASPLKVGEYIINEVKKLVK